MTPERAKEIIAAAHWGNTSAVMTQDERAQLDRMWLIASDRDGSLSRNSIIARIARGLDPVTGQIHRTSNGARRACECQRIAARYHAQHEIARDHGHHGLARRYAAVSARWAARAREEMQIEEPAGEGGHP